MTTRDKITYAVPTHTWMTLPGTAVQVRHEAGRSANVTVSADGALTIEEPEHFWATRPMPPAVPADLGGKVVELDPSSPQAAVKSWREAQ